MALELFLNKKDVFVQLIVNIQKILNIASVPPVAEVASLAALRSVSDSQRHRILSLLISEALTPSQIAKRMNIARTRVYYHLDRLAEHRFIRVVAERPVGAMTERTYRACARRFKVDRRMLAEKSSASEVNDAQARLLERSADDLRSLPKVRPRSAKSPTAQVLVSRSFPRLSRDQALKLRAALARTINTYTNISRRLASKGKPYELTIALFPIEGEQS